MLKNKKSVGEVAANVMIMLIIFFLILIFVGFFHFIVSDFVDGSINIMNFGSYEHEANMNLINFLKTPVDNKNFGELIVEYYLADSSIKDVLKQKIEYFYNRNIKDFYTKNGEDCVAISIKNKNNMNVFSKDDCQTPTSISYAYLPVPLKNDILTARVDLGAKGEGEEILLSTPSVVSTN